jgi:hypothetical protein
MDEDKVKEILVDRRVSDFVTTRANLAWVDSHLVSMVRTPDTYEPMLSLDPGASNYINRLSQPMRREFIRVWQEFIKESNEKSVRRMAEDPAFLSSGDSAKSSESSPGQMESPSISSPESSSPSVPSASGSTT